MNKTIKQVAGGLFLTLLFAACNPDRDFGPETPIIDQHDNDQITALMSQASGGNGTGDLGNAVFFAEDADGFGAKAVDTLSNDNVNYEIHFDGGAEVATGELEKFDNSQFVLTEFNNPNFVAVYMKDGTVVPGNQGTEPIFMYVDKNTVDLSGYNYGSVPAWQTDGVTGQTITVDTARVGNSGPNAGQLGELYAVAYTNSVGAPDTILTTLYKDANGNLELESFNNPNYKAAYLQNSSDDGASNIAFLMVENSATSSTDCGIYDDFSTATLIGTDQFEYVVGACDASSEDNNPQGPYYQGGLAFNGIDFHATFDGIDSDSFAIVQLRPIDAPDTIVHTMAVPANPDGTPNFDDYGVIGSMANGDCCIDISICECKQTGCTDGLERILKYAYERQNPGDTFEPCIIFDASFPGDTTVAAITQIGKVIDCVDCDEVTTVATYMQVYGDGSQPGNSGPYTDIATFNAPVEVIGFDDSNNTAEVQIEHPTIQDSIIVVGTAEYDPETCAIICTEINPTPNGTCCDTEFLDILQIDQQAIEDLYENANPGQYQEAINNGWPIVPRFGGPI